MKKIFKIEGMHCNVCENKIKDSLKDKVNYISVSYSKGEAEIDFDSDKISEKEIHEKIQKCGYNLKENKINDKKNNFGWIILITSSLLLIYIIYNLLSGINIGITVVGQKTNLILYVKI